MHADFSGHPRPRQHQRLLLMAGACPDVRDDDGSSAIDLSECHGHAAVAPWDPFLQDHPSTWTSPVERLRADGDTIAVRCHVLPHRDRLGTDQWERAAGPDGWTAQQGFYVYRNRRLLVAGSWLGLGRGRAWTKAEAHRLARIRLDVPNTLDSAWKIDICKSIARPPQALRERLQRLAEDTRERARRVFAHRGQPVRPRGGADVPPVWIAEHFSGGLRYRIDRGHPAMQAVSSEPGSHNPRSIASSAIIRPAIASPVFNKPHQRHELP